MSGFEALKLTKQLQKAINDLGFVDPTPIQAQAFSKILSGKDIVGIAQTGTGKTLGYLLPILQELKYSEQEEPRALILVPTRELVLQVVAALEKVITYMNTRIVGVYGGVNINTHKKAVAAGCDIVVATPGRMYDLAVSRILRVKAIKKVVIDEVDVMLDLGFRPQLINIFDLLPERRQHIMFSATMTDDVDALIDDFFISPHKVSIAVSGTRLENIAQTCYTVPNFYTKANLLKYLLKDRSEYTKTLVFISTKKNADRLFEALTEDFGGQLCIIHSNKTQNYRLRSIEDFNGGVHRILIATDVMARGLDLEEISHVINFDTPNFPENYMHRIGRTGRAGHQGKSILLSTPKEQEAKAAIQELMEYTIPETTLPNSLPISNELIPEERPKIVEINNPHKVPEGEERGASFHEKKAKNQKTNQGGSYRREIAKKYKKPKTRGDKNYNKRNKRK